MSEVHISRPCRLCRERHHCGEFIRALRDLVADWESTCKHAVPDVYVECVYYVRSEEL